MKLKLLLITIALFVGFGTSYGQIISWNFTTNNNPNVNLPAGTTALSYNTGGTLATSGCIGNGYSSNNWTVNEYLQIVAPTTGYNITTMTFNVQSSNAGPGNFKVQYSSTGTGGTFTDLGTTFVSPTACGSLSADFTAINALDNNANTVIRLVFTGGEADGNPATGNPNANGTFRIDDLVINGTSITSVPTVSTTTVSATAQFSATSGGNVTATGGATITARGIIWGTTAGLSITQAPDRTSSNGLGTGSFTSASAALKPNTTYYYRAYAINSVGTGYGTESSFTTLFQTGTQMAFWNFGPNAGGYTETVTAENVTGTPTITLTDGTKDTNGKDGIAYTDIASVDHIRGQSAGWDDINNGATAANIIVGVNTTGYKDIHLKFDYKSESADQYDVDYRLNGGSWISVSTNTALIPNFIDNNYNWNTVRIDLIGITAINNYTGPGIVEFRINGFADGTGNNKFVFDNLEIIGTVMSPEIDVTGNGNSIPDGTTATSTTDHTDFGTVSTTAGTIVRTFTILNTGTAALSLTGASPYMVIGGTHQADFTVTAIPANSIATSGTTTFQVTFDPSADGVRTASIAIANDDTNENPYNFNIQGIGIGVPVITSSLTAFGNQGASFTYTITATNAPTDYNATSLPTGLSIDTLTGIISGTPTVSGSFNVTITATNVAGTDTETLVIAISSGPCLSESFDLATAVPSGWSGTSSNDSVSGHYLSGSNCRALGNGIELISASTSNPSSISFYVDASGSGGQLGTLQYRIGAGAWTTVGTFTATTAGTTVAFDLTSSPNLTAQTNVSFKISSAANTIYIDDFKVFCGASCTPLVDTPTSTSIAATTSTLGGNITSIGCSTVTTRGIEWSITSGFANGSGTQVTTSGSFTTGVFTQAVTGLPSGAVIYYKAFATNSEGTAYSSQASFTTLGSEINIIGVNGANNSIADGDTVPQGTDNTLFGNTDIGSIIEKIFRIENLGTGDLNITSISMVGGTAPDDFVISGITLPTTIAGGASLDFSVIFSPSAGGTRNTTLTIVNNDYDENPYNFVIQGTGIVVASVDINVTGSGQSIPDNSIYPFPLNHTAFSSATVGVTTVTRIFTIENLGSSTLSLTGTPLVSIIGPHATLFTVTVLPSATIAGGSSSTFQVTFNPTSLGTKNATIVIANNDSDENPYNFNISGIAKGNKNIYVYGNGNDVSSGATTTSLINLTNFGSIALTTGVKQNTFVISNLADADRYFSNVSISGTDASMFTVVAQPPVNALSSGNSTSFTINFTPTSVGTKNALISFSSYTNSTKTTQDLSDPSTYTFAISGDGIVYTVCDIGVVQTIAQQDFEDTPATPTLGYTYTTEGVVSITGGTFDNGSGSKNAFIGAKSFQFTGIGTSNIKTTVVNFNAIDVSKYVNINLSFKTGAFRIGTFQGLDINEFIQLESSIDGGVSWSTEGVLRAYNNSRWDFAATGVFNAYYTGTNNGATIDSRSGNAELANGYATYNVKNLPRSSNLLLRLTLVVDREDEIWAIDNIKLEGQLPLSTTWDGSAWSPGVPNSSTKAIFDGDYTTDLTLPIPIPSVKTCECLINATKTVTISSGDYLEVQSDLTVNGILNFDDASSLVQVNDNAVNTGIIKYNRTTPDVFRTDYTYWASPVAGYTLGGVSQNLTLWDKYYSYNSIIEDWKQESPSTTMFAGTGYIIRAPETPFQNTFDAFFIGEPNNGAYSVNGVIDNRSYLLGNPYPSALDADTFLNDNAGVLDGTLYFWTHITPLGIGVSNPGTGLYAYSRDDYAAYNPVGGVSVDDVPFGPGGDPAPSGGVKPSGKIASGQGFFASSKTTITGADIVFNNSMRVGVIDISKEINSQFFKTRSPKTKLATIEKHRIWLDLTNSQGAFKQTLIGYITDATNEYDSRFDGESYDANEFVDFYSVNQDKNLVIQGRALPFDENDLVPLGFRTTIEGAFTINIDELDGALTNQAVFIEDKLTNTVFDLKTGNYTFNTVAGTFNDRFVLRYTDRTLGTANFETLENQVLVSNKNKQIKVNSSVETIDKVSVYDILGRLLFKKEKVNSNELTIPNLVSKQQMVLVKVSLKNGQTVTKKIIY